MRRQNLQRQGLLLPQTDFGGFGWILSSSGQGEVEPHGHSLTFRPRLGQLTKRLRAVLCVYYVSMTVRDSERIQNEIRFTQTIGSTEERRETL